MAPASLDRCHESNTRASSRDAPYLPPKLSSKQQSRLNKCPVCSEQALKRSTGHDIDLSCWMSRMPNEISLSSLWIPGTHESASFFGIISTCQTYPLSVQLHLGVRFFDLRFSIKGGRLRAYHGIQSQRATAQDLFQQLYTFLDHHPSETVVVSVKQEDATQGFEALVRHHLEQQRQRWFLENRFPELQEVRGKVVLFSRFGSGSELGLHPRRWPYNLPREFSYQLGQVQVLTQDWCDIKSPLSIPEKFKQVTHLCLMPTRGASFKINFTSATGLYGGLPKIISRGLGWTFLGLGIRGTNDRLYEFLQALKEGEKPVAPGGQCFMLDFAESPAELTALIVSFNSLAELNSIAQEQKA